MSDSVARRHEECARARRDRRPAVSEDARVVGREEQVALLRGHVEAVSAGAGARLVLVHGARGAGVSTVVRAALDRSAAEGSVSPTPYVVTGIPWESGISGALLTRIAEDLAARNRTGPGLPAPLPSGPGEAGAALARVLRSSAEAEPPFVVVIEDAQAADAFSLRAVSSAVHRLGDSPVLVVVCATTALVDGVPGLAGTVTGRARPAFGETDATLLDIAALHERDVIAVGPLTAGEVARLATARRHPILQETATRIVEHTRGVARDIVDLVAYHPDLDAAASGGRLPTTPATTMTLRRRLERAHPDTRRLVEATAVLHEGACLDEVARTAELDDPLPAADEATRLGVLGVVEDVDGVHVRFVSPLLRATAYELLSLVERRRLHAVAADVVDDPGERLVQRAAMSEGPDETLARELADHAATAADDGRWGSAARAYLAAVPLSRPGTDRGSRLVSALDATTGAGDLPFAGTLVPRVESLPYGPHRDAALAYVALNEGRRVHAAHLLARAWRGTNSRLDPQAAALVAQRRALHGLFDWNGTDVLAWVEEARRHAAVDSPPVLEARVIVGLGLAATGRPDEAREAYEATDDIEHGPQAQRALMGHGWLEVGLDDVRQAAWRLTTSAPAQWLRGSTRVSLWSLGWLARARLALGEWDAALDAVAHAERLVDVSDIGVVRPLVHWTGAEIHALRGDDDLAAWHASRAESGPQEYATTLVPSVLARAHVHRARGDHAAVLRTCEPLVALRRIRPIDEPGFWPWQDVYADALIASGRLEEADAFLAPLEQNAADRDHRSTRARLGVCRGRLLGAQGDLDAARVAFGEALAVCDTLPMPYLHASTLFALGVTLRHAGHRRDAAGPLGQSRDLFERLGADPLVAQCDRELGAGRSGPVRSADETDSLTPQEEAIANLVALGRRNRDIAAELYISVKTVEYHLTRVYAKIGVSSRGELAARLRERDDR